MEGKDIQQGSYETVRAYQDLILSIFNDYINNDEQFKGHPYNAEMRLLVIGRVINFLQSTFYFELQKRNKDVINSLQENILKGEQQ